MSGKITAKINNYEVWVVKSPEMKKHGHEEFQCVVKALRSTKWVYQSGFRFRNEKDAERDGISAARSLPPATMMKLSSGFAGESTRSLASFEKEVEARLESGKEADQPPGMGDSYKDKISGGMGDKKTPDDFHPELLAAGVAVEMEHTDDPMVAQEIAIDHLTEDLNYYEKLKEAHLSESFHEKVEKKLAAGKEEEKDLAAKGPYWDAKISVERLPNMANSYIGKVNGKRVTVIEKTAEKAKTAAHKWAIDNLK